MVRPPAPAINLDYLTWKAAIGPTGKGIWPNYDCARNTWSAAAIAGPQPIGRPGRPAEHNVSLGLSYDANRRIVWAVDSRMTTYALRLDPELPATK